MEPTRPDNADKLIDEVFEGRETVTRDELRLSAPLNDLMYRIVDLPDGELTKDVVRRHLLGEIDDASFEQLIPPRHGRGDE